MVFAGLHWLDWTAANFALLNLALALVWIGLAFAIGREFRALAQKNSFNVPPEVGQPIPDLMYAPGSTVPAFRAGGRVPRCRPGRRAESQRTARGRPAVAAMGAVRCEAPGVPRHLPDGYCEEVTIEVVASDVDGTQAASIFVMRRALQAD